MIACRARIRLVVWDDERFLCRCEGRWNRLLLLMLLQRRRIGVRCRMRNARLWLWDNCGDVGCGEELLLQLLDRHWELVHLGMFEWAGLSRVATSWPGQARRILYIYNPSQKRNINKLMSKFLQNGSWKKTHMEGYPLGGHILQPSSVCGHRP